MRQFYLKTVSSAMSIIAVLFVFAVGVYAQTPVNCTADFNKDNNVDLRDYSVLIQNFLKSPPIDPQTDINRDNVVDLTDYSILVYQFLKPCASPSPTATPTTGSPSPTSTQPTSTPILGVPIYVSPSGNDANSGTSTAPVRTIQKAVDLAKNRSDTAITIQVGPGTYREDVNVADFTNSTKSLTIAAQNGANSVFVNGSENSKNLTWTKGTNGLPFPAGAQSHVYWTDITSWNAIPEMMHEVSTDQSSIVNYPKAREPDFRVDTAHKYHENWWNAENGTLNTLTDNANDAAGSYPQASEQAGNLKSLNGISGASFVGARIFVMDNSSGHDQDTGLVTSHNTSTGTITLDRNMTYYTGSPLIGSGSKYYIEGMPQFLDSAGEWYVDKNTKRLYLWPKNDVNPSQLSLEWGVRPSVFHIQNSKNITLKNMTIQFSNYLYYRNYGLDGAIRVDNTKTQSSDRITLDSLIIRNNGVGIRVDQDTENGLQTRNLKITNTQVLNTDGLALSIFHFPYNPIGVQDIIVERSTFDTANYRAVKNGDGVWIQHVKNFTFRFNKVARMAHNGVEIQGADNNNILVHNNLFEENCLNGYDCGGFKLFGGPFSMHNVLVAHNIVRGTKGWSYVAAAKNLNGRAGYLGFGMYSDNVFATDGSKKCPIIYYRNAIVNTSENGIHLTSSRDHCMFNNVTSTQAAGVGFDNRGGTNGFNTMVKKNIFNQAGNTLNTLTADDRGVVVDMDTQNQGQIQIDGNTYKGTTSTWSDMHYKNSSGGTIGTYKTINDIRNSTVWEDTGRDTTTGTFGLTNQNNYDVSQIEQSFGVGTVTTPSEVSSLINFLNQTLGTSFADTKTVGITP